MRHRSKRNLGDPTAAFAGGTSDARQTSDEDSLRAIHQTRVEMLARMTEALEGKSANARDALAHAANRLKQD